MKKKKKINEPIIINQEPLSTTTIGKIEIKENGPIFAIIGIAIFVICIILLPTISEWVTSLSNPNIVDNVPPGTAVTPPSKDEEEDNSEIKYYELKDDLLIILNGFNFSNFRVDSSTNVLTFTLANQNGDSEFFSKSNYYLELYTTDELLLQRIKLTTEIINGSITFTYDIKEALTNGTISKVAIVLKTDEDCPPIELGTDAKNNSILTCEKDNEILTYQFVHENNVYHLTQITEQNSYKTTNPNYSTYLQEYTALSNNYSGINGVKTTLSPTATGFSFETNIDLEEISVANYHRIFKKDIYYDKNTEARVVSFELSASGYTCS